MENSISDSEVKEAPELVVELEVDQENLVKMLKALTEAGVEFKLKLVEEKDETPAPPPAVTFTPAFIDPNMRWYQPPQMQQYPYPQPYTVGPIVSPYTSPGTAVPQPSVPPITISKADLSGPITSSTVVGYPPGTQISYTTN